MNFSITDVKKYHVPLETSDVLGEWSAKYGPFSIHRGSIRKYDGHPVAANIITRSTANKNRGIRMAHGPERDALCAAALAAWEALP